jgi:hypothetical protein
LNEEHQHLVIGFFYTTIYQLQSLGLCGSDEFCADSSLVAVRANHAG